MDRLRRYPQVVMNISIYEEKIFKRLKEEHGLSVREVLEYSSCGCDKCKGTSVIAYDKNDGEPFEIPRGLLRKK